MQLEGEAVRSFDGEIRPGRGVYDIRSHVVGAAGGRYGVAYRFRILHSPAGYVWEIVIEDCQAACGE